ncbi:hypothetical protein VTN02DRAFT_470 [Thermoascus thermophilus]
MAVEDRFDDSSDYGSDFTPEQEELLNELLATVATQHAHAHTRSAPVVVDEPVVEPAQRQNLLLPPSVLVGDFEDHEVLHPRVPRAPATLGRERRLPPGAARPAAARPVAGDPRASVEHPDSIEGRERERERDIAREQQWTKRIQETAGKSTPKRKKKNNPADESRSPLERFRQPPKKALSVTDLVSPAWCELQYWYTLTKHGRKRRTAAMKLGSAVHKTLEDAVHTTVRVEVTTKEDAWALRLWNVIQGLRTLRESGLTRELEVWGLVDGEIVNGVIDQLSYECPDPALEASAAAYYADAEAARAALPEYQMSLSDYLLAPSRGGQRLSDLAWSEPALSAEPAPSEAASAAEQPPADTDTVPGTYNIPRIYMTDIKTRASRSIPTVSSTSFRPTLLQLQLYYHMLNRLTTSDDVTIEALAARYALDPHRPFTDHFVLQVGGALNGVLSQESKSERDSPSSQDSTDILLSHNNLASLWALMKEHLRLTFLPPEDTSSSSFSSSPSIPSPTQPRSLEPYPTLLSPLLTATYLSSAPPPPTEEAEAEAAEEKPSAALLGSRSFLFDPALLSSYVADQMAWWRGRRDPRGVEALDAWKCRVCEFRDECVWRAERERAFAEKGGSTAAAAAATTAAETTTTTTTTPTKRGRGRPRKVDQEQKEQQQQKEV